MGLFEASLNRKKLKKCLMYGVIQKQKEKKLASGVAFLQTDAMFDLRI